MSGFEIVGVILGGVPIVLSGFREIRQFLQHYKKLDRRIRIALDGFDKEMDVFRMIWNEIQSVNAGPNEVGRWLSDNSDLRNHTGLESSLGALNPDCLKVLSAVLEDSRITVEKVNEILTELGEVCRSNDTPSVTRLVTDTLPLFSPTHPPPQTPRSMVERTIDAILPRKQQARILRAKVLEQLKGCTLAMCSNNAKLSYAVSCGKAGPKIVTPLIQGEVVSHHVVMRARQDVTAMRIASTKVYNITLQSSLHCKCHLVHLRLDTQSIGTLTAGAAGQQMSGGRVATKIFFRFTDQSIDNTKPAHLHTGIPVLQFFFTDSDSPDTTPPATCPMPICEGLAHSDADYARFFRDNDGNGTTGFLLQHTSNKEARALDSERISFDELVSSRCNQLLPRDTFLIAANLARSLLRFHSSPWVRDWTPQTIQFFQHYGRAHKYEQPTFASYLWTPHLFLSTPSPNSVPPMTTGQAIFELGMMLLNLGRRIPLELEGLIPWERKMTMSGAIGELAQQMGVRYADIVVRYLDTWSVNGVDLMQEDSLTAFLSDILLFETLANCYPETVARAVEGIL